MPSGRGTISKSSTTIADVAKARYRELDPGFLQMRVGLLDQCGDGRRVFRSKLHRAKDVDELAEDPVRGRTPLVLSDPRERIGERAMDARVPVVDEPKIVHATG